ncbi:hypothetical protein A3193_06730 [Candidatus Thiodiazotropha endoloripes]|nr:hypothetical protein A3193_06730 [Candidatus Thiodiazotropha endoloripes]
MNLERMPAQPIQSQHLTEFNVSAKMKCQLKRIFMRYLRRHKIRDDIDTHTGLILGNIQVQLVVEMRSQSRPGSLIPFHSRLTMGID